MKKILLLLVVACSSLVMLAQNEFQVSNIRKISATQGGFTGKLDEGDRFSRCTCIGDVDGDGIEDLAVGAQGDDDGYFDSGAVWILFLNNDRTVKAQQKISAIEGGFSANLGSDAFGMAITSLGDFDKDGTPDIAVTAYYDTDGGTNCGAIYIILLKPDGKVKSHQKISGTAGGITDLEAGLLFGSGICNIGDIDNDGITDLAVGAPRYSNINSAEGAIWVLRLNANGTVKSQQIIGNSLGNFNYSLASDEMFGTTVSNIGDIDGDGITDIAVHARGNDDGATDAGATYILFLNSNGKVKGSQKISAKEGSFKDIIKSNDWIGFSSVGIGDLDGDGVNDMVTSALNSDIWGTDKGAIYFVFLNKDGTVKKHQEISELAPLLKNGDHVGVMFSIFEKKNIRNHRELVVGSFLDDDGATNAGAVYIMDLGASPVNPIANAGNDQTICGNETATIDGSNSTNPTATVLSYSWNSPNYTISTPNAKNFVFTPQTTNTTTTYTFVLTVTSGDLVSEPDTVYVTVNPTPSIPTIAFSNDKITSNVNATTYNWFFNNEQMSNANSNPLNTNTPGDYHLILKNEFGCSSSKSNTVTVQNISGLSVSRTELILKATEGSFGTVKITTNLTWTATCDQDWLTLKTSTGTGTSTLLFTAQANSAETNRIATVTISAEGIDPVVVKITQLAKPFVKASLGNIALQNTEGTSATVEVLSNTNWKATPNQDWLTTSPTGNNGNATITISALANTTLEERTGIVTLTAAGVDTIQIIVTQAQGSPFLTVSELEQTFESDSISSLLQIQSNTTWTVISNSNWVVLSKNEGNGTDSLNFTLENNSTSTDREAFITIEANGITEPIQFRIIQKGQPILSASTDSLSFTHAAGQLLSFEISANIDWSITIDQNWIVCDKQTGNGNSKITISNLANATTKTRTGTITLTGLNVQPITITVTQKAMPYSNVETETVYINKEKDGTGGVEIKTNQSWVVQTAAEWLTINTPNGLGDGVISFKANEANLSVFQRSAVIIITMSDSSVVNVTVIQRPTQILSISASHVTIKAAQGSNTAVPVVCSTDWTAKSNQNWLSVSALSGNGDYTFEFIANENSNLESRFAWVIISATDIESDTIFIEQFGAERKLQTNKNEIRLDSTANSSDNIEIESNVSWTASSSEDWLNISPSSELGNKLIVITAQGNHEAIERTAIVTITGEGTEPVTITVIQAAGKVTDVNNLNQSAITMYPNPTSNGFHIKGVNPESIVTISDINGRCVFTQKVNQGEYINTAQLRNGLYFVQIHSNGTIFNQKLIIK